MSDREVGGGSGGRVQTVNGTTTIIKDAPVIGVVRDAGSSAVAVGYALCYNGTTDTSFNQVAIPSTSNNTRFAGVLYNEAIAASHPASNQYTIAKPGSIVDIYVDATVTAGQIVTALVGTGAFSGTYNAGWGRGSARCLAARTGAGLVKAEILDGAETGLVQALTAAAGANTIIQHGLLVIPTQTPGAAPTAVLAAPAFDGQKLGILTGTLTTNSFELTIGGAPNSMAHVSKSATAYSTVDAIDVLLSAKTLTFATGGIAYATLVAYNTQWKLVDVSAARVTPA